MASRWYPPEHQGLAMGIAGAGNSGTLFATLFAPRLAEAFGWHMVFGLAIIPLAFAFALFLAFAKDARPGESIPSPVLRRWSRLRDGQRSRPVLGTGVFESGPRG